MTRTTYSRFELDLNKYYEFKKEAVKPNGLWYGINDEWERFAALHFFNRLKANKYILNIDMKNVLVLKSVADVQKFVKNHGDKSWLEIRACYDGIEVRNYKKIMDSNQVLPYWLQLWSIDSGCIWNLKQALIDYDKE